MFKAIVTNATVSNNKVSASKDSRYLRFVKPEMYSIPTISENKSVTGKFVLLGSEKLSGNFNTILRFANIASEDAQAYYQSYAQGINLEPMKGKSKKAIAHNQLIEDAQESLEALLEQGFYAIINLHTKPQNIFGSFDTKYPRGVQYSDIFTVFGAPIAKNGYTNYSTRSLNGFLGYASKGFVAKVAQANPENVTSFIEIMQEFKTNNQVTLDGITMTEKLHAEISATENSTADDYSSIDYKQLSTDKTAMAEQALYAMLSMPFVATSKGGAIKIFA